jgi:hypothetical protein
MTILRPVSRLALMFGARSNAPEPADPQPGSLMPQLDTIDREQAERAAVRLGMLPGETLAEDALIDVQMPGPRQRLPTTQAPREPIPVPLSDPLLIAAREAGKTYEATAEEWTWEGYNAAIITAVLPIHDAIRESGIESSADGGT